MGDENSEKTQIHNADGAAPEDSTLTQAHQLAEKYKNDYLYLRAEFENYKRNAIKERSDLTRYGSERLAVELLNVVDNFERALEGKLTSENLAQYSKGIEMTAQELKAVLTKFGITEVPSHGKAFDPSVHEALGADENTDVPSGHIAKVFRKPYKLHEKLIRPGQVIVSSKK